MSLDQQITSKFGKLEDETFIETYKKVMSIFNLSVEDLFLKWESYNLSHQDLEPTSINLTKLQASIQSGLSKRLVPSSLTKLRPKNLSSPSFMNNILPSTPLTSSSKKRKLESTPLKTPAGDFTTSSPLSKFDQTPSAALKSEESGKIIETLNPHLKQSAGINLDSEQKNIRLMANFDAKKYHFRTMRQKLLEAADVLDDQIDTFIQIVQEHYKFQDDEFGNPAILSQHNIIAVGRIVPDSPLISSEINLNDNSLSLETSRVSGIGQRVPLNLQSLSDFSFFPGQIVALRGINPTGESFIAHEIIELPILGAPISSGEELSEYSELTNGDNVKVVVTVGPYTTNKNLEFTELDNLVDKINNETKPHMVIMLGPFVDITHPKIADGSATIPGSKQPQTLDDIFRIAVAPVLRKINTKIQVILVPSTRDSNIKHSAYPQDSFNKKILQLPKNFRCFPNPSSFQINDLLIGISHNDIFKDLKDINKGKYEKENRFDRIAKHVIEQRRYYPLFPAGIKTKKIKNETGEELIEHISGADLDIPFLGLTELSGVIPDILILPSELRFFAKIISNVLVINPSNFMRMNSNGNYCVLDIAPADVSKLTKVNDTDFLHDVWERVRVDIVKT